MRDKSTAILRYCTAIWKVGYLDSWLFCTVKKPCLTSRLSALRFSIRFAFLAL